jgi:ABC-type multidrug transport system ATPase subunit
MAKAIFSRMPDPAIIVENLSKSFGSRAVFEGCTFSVHAGAIFGLVGLNGAGKTTLIRVLSGLLRPDGGSVSVLGSAPWNHEERMYKRLGIVLENDGFCGNLDFADNLRLFASAKALPWPEVTAYIREFWAGTFIDSEMRSPSKKVKLFSRGQRMQCGICRAFLGWPDACLFDEPTIALDVEAYDHFCGMVRQAQNRGSAVLISSHQLSFIEELCTSVGILDDKSLHSLETGPPGARPVSGEEWIVTAQSAEKFKDIFMHYCGENAAVSGNAWRLTIKNPEQTVPDLVAALCKAGCRVMEVRPVKKELREKIRTYYEKN